MAIVIIAILVNAVTGRKEGDYRKAISAYKAGRFSDAYFAFNGLRDYKDGETYFQLSSDAWDYERALEAAQSEDYVSALRWMTGINTDQARQELTKLQEQAYQSALDMVNRREFVKAYDVFEALGPYRDAPEQLKEIDTAKKQELYDKAAKELASGNYESAIRVFAELEGFSDASQRMVEAKVLQLKNPVVGGSVYFGSYEQDNKRANGKEEIKWLVADIKDNRALLVSEKILDRIPYR